MSVKVVSSGIESFVKNMTHLMFSEFQYAMQARLHTDEALNRYLNPKGFLSAEEIDLVRAGKKIDAIKAARVRTNAGLKEAKDMVDAWCKVNMP